MTTTALVPAPGDDLVPDGWWLQVVVPWADRQADIDDLASAAAHVAGLIVTYRRLGSDTLELTKACRYLEVRWGEMLGQVVERQRTDLEPGLSQASDSLSKDSRLRFRQLAGGRDQVIELLERATESDEITRAACIRVARPPAPSARAAAAALSGMVDDEDDERIADAAAWQPSHERAVGRLLVQLQESIDRVTAARAAGSREAVAEILRRAEVKARQAAAAAGDLAFQFER